jgi:hypothetical protein
VFLFVFVVAVAFLFFCFFSFPIFCFFLIFSRPGLTWLGIRDLRKGAAARSRDILGNYVPVF